MTTNSNKYQSGREVFAEFIPDYVPPDEQLSHDDDDSVWNAKDSHAIVNVLLEHLNQQLQNVGAPRKPNAPSGR